MQTFFAISSAALGFFAALILLFDWLDLLTKFQLKRNVADRDAALKIIAKAENQFRKRFEGKEIRGNFTLIGALYGLFAAQRLNASLFDKMHQAFRRSLDLPEFSLQETEGLLDRGRVIKSFYDTHNAILRRRDEHEQRDLRIVALWLMIATLMTAILSTLF
ncbi:hypothetical protein G6M14_09030 [Agrobacterium tumefaciens]|uniref:hypothetical protein n=1 Tax=Agrobacterium tumefaciens TaxID=358 RepID=UPI0001FC5C13|nr:hypothetical protein [Agrobacterium tumefaciens]ADY64739.1 hypothetical protein AGROH133_06869 [Agrobacterium tumefaciens]NSZ06501.1 hypothetical protein [Agrobacterium tumefaciens]